MEFQPLKLPSVDFTAKSEKKSEIIKNHKIDEKAPIEWFEMVKVVNFGKTCNFVFWMLVFCAHIVANLLSRPTYITIVYYILDAFIFQIEFIFN